MRTQKSWSILMVLVLMGTTGVSSVVAQSAATADEELVGRDVAREGTLQTVDGTLRYQDDEWYLSAGRRVYELHMGPFGHDESLALRDGSLARVEGFVVGDHIAPLSLVSEGVTHEFWHADRYPLWAGAGNRRNAVDAAGQGASRPADAGVRALAFNRAGTVAASARTPAQSGDSFERGFRNQDLRPGIGRR